MIGIGPQYYSTIYNILITLLSLFVFAQYSAYPVSHIHSNGNRLSFSVFFLTLFLVMFVGTRPLSGRYFGDTSGYVYMWNFNEGSYLQFTWNTTNKIFDNLFFFLLNSDVNIYVFFVIMAFIYFVGIAGACSKMFPNDKLAAFLVYLGALSTFSYATNGLKSGAAASFFLVALAFYEKRQWLWTLIFIFLSWGFHHSMVLPVIAFVVCLFVRNPRWYFLFWGFCFFIALFHITFFQHFFAGFSNDQAVHYLIGNGENVRLDILGGFRIDFILYSAAPIVFGWYGVQRKKLKFSSNYIFLLNLYTLINAIWMLCMYAEFTNRISYLSWLLLPIVLIYPFLKENWGNRQHQTFQWVAFGHLAFTLFMSYIY